MTEQAPEPTGEPEFLPEKWDLPEGAWSWTPAPEGAADEIAREQAERVAAVTQVRNTDVVRKAVAARLKRQKQD